MTEEAFVNVSFPVLKELENKVGRKIPESLLLWMRNAADSEDGEIEDQNYLFGDSFANKLSNLKKEMRWMRSADVRILRQLVAVHEGIESMHWLMTERSTSASRDSSLAGSISSLVAVEEHAHSLSPCRDIPRSTYPKDLPDSFSQVPSDPSHTDSDHSHLRSCAENPRQESSPSTDCLAQTDFQVSQLQDSEARPSQDLKEDANPVKEVHLGCNSFDLIEGSQETKQQTHYSIAEEEEKMMAVLFGYDAQWCWIESQDDVTFL
ncbi:leucine rich adaptor protein 1-like [Hippocampus comes]|uniref:leucine rich adaptor protein 1-like n=1 Tax=Hippocampus comes TaxID=109280 RepID=UPI00094E1A4F|nr:PREDICTED: leucine rich adaptor protein 1-like [Hippocampus comes]